MKLLNVIVVITLVWQLCRLLHILPSMLEILHYKASGKEKREIEARQRVAIDKRIVLMHQHLESTKSSHQETMMHFQDANPDMIRGLNHMHQSALNLARRNCDRDIEKIKKSYWGYIE